LAQHTTSRILPTYDISPGSLTLPAPEAGNFVELILLYHFGMSTLSHVTESNTVDPRMSNGLILEQLETRTKNSKKKSV
jgi:hypothetical protein